MPGYQNITAKRRIVFAKKRPPIELYTKALWREVMIHAQKSDESVFSRTCAGKRHLKSRERGDRKGANGGKREGERSERESVVPRQNKDSRRVGGHAPPQRHLERSAATTKTRFTGRKQNKQSEFCCLPVVPRKWGLTGEKTHERATRSEGVCSPVPYLAIIVFTSNAPNSSSFPVSPMMFSSISATYSLRPASEGCSFRVPRLALPPLS